MCIFFLVKNTRKPILILGAYHTVIQQGADMLDEPVVLYNTTELVKGTSVVIVYFLKYYNCIFSTHRISNTCQETTPVYIRFRRLHI